MLRRLAAALALALLPSLALAQAVPLQAGPSAPGRVPMYSGAGGSFGQPVIQDSGPASGGLQGLGLNELLLVERGITSGPLGTNLCDYDGPITGPYHYVCLGPNAQGGALIAVGSGGGALPQGLKLIVDGQLLPVLGSVNGMPSVVDTATLALLPSTYAPAVMRLDFSAGVGAPPEVFRTSAAPCSIAGGDGGSQVPSSDGKCWLGRPASPVDVREFGADSTGVKDSTTAFQAALTAAPAVYAPTGHWRLTNGITLGLEGSLKGDGVDSSVLEISTDFNMTAPAVVELNAPNPNLNGETGTFYVGGKVDGIGFNFAQPTALTRATVVQYPFAMVADVRGKIGLGRVRVSNGWGCLRAHQDVGGSDINRLECGAYSTTGAIDIDGSYDYIHAESIECWPWGGALNPQQLAVYQDQTTVCASIGRVDGLAISKMSTFASSISYLSDASIIGAHIGILQMDTDGSSVSVSGGLLTVGSFFSAKTGNAIATNAILSVTGGAVTIGAVDLIDGTVRGDGMEVTAGTLTVNGGHIAHFAGTTAAAGASGTGSLSVNHIRGDLAISGITPANRLTGYYRAQGNTASLQARDNIAPDAGALTGPYVEVDVDVPDDHIAGNTFNGWAYILPNTNLGFYDMAEPQTVFVTPTFLTPGSFVPQGQTTTNAVMYRRGSYVDLSLDVTFGTNAYTGAANPFQLVIANAPATADFQSPCALGSMAMASPPTGSQVTATMQTSSIFFPIITPGAKPGFLVPPYMPPSVSGYEFQVSCHYRVR